jgi:uncharacterized protein
MRQVRLSDVYIELPSTSPSLVLQEVDPPHRTMHIPIAQAEGVAISYAWRGLPTPRPLSHELFTTVMEHFGVTLELVEVTGAEGKTYFAQLTLVSGARRAVVPCRPSDGVALALRQRLVPPIMVTEALLPSETG